MVSGTRLGVYKRKRMVFLKGQRVFDLNVVLLIFHCSDTASLNSLGYCQIEGRIKDLIIRGGENIYPAEIEQFLFQHPKIQEVQVGRCTARWQQRTQRM